jgi:hypothetical protein
LLGIGHRAVVCGFRKRTPLLARPRGKRHARLISIRSDEGERWMVGWAWLTLRQVIMIAADRWHSHSVPVSDRQCRSKAPLRRRPTPHR